MPFVSRRDFVRSATAASLLAGAGGVPALAATTRLNVGTIGHSMAHFALYLAQQEGYFGQNGVDIGKPTELSTGALVGTAVTSGSIDVGSSPITDVFSLAKAGRSAKIIAVSMAAFYVDLIASTKLMQSANLRTDSPLEDKVRALRGKNIGITGPGSGTEALVKYLLETQKIDPTRDVQLINVGANIASVLAALRTNRIDAVSFAWPLGQQAQVEGIGETLISPARGDVPAMDHQMHGVIYATQDVIDHKREAIEGFIRGYARACSTIINEPVKAREVLTSFYPGMEPRALELTFQVFRLRAVPSSPIPDRQGYEKAIKFHLAEGLITQEYPYDSLVAKSVIEDALRKH
ncbi:MAG TPA: ABC transporter substrate-binding protein [Candidatus Sulfotelmatobacter sp.]|nr:ABC transporter substrate-binding protein [Candidatus Sulfotelmatobacter sp.]